MCSQKRIGLSDISDLSYIEREAIKELYFEEISKEQEEYSKLKN